MDTRFFVSREEFHNVQMDVRQLQAIQSTQAERLQRLEKRHQDDAAMRSAWSNSPFPNALVGTPQHGPVRLPSTEAFDLDEQSQTLGSLQLEPDDEPIRRAAAASRANSVRFDESANLAQSARNFSDIGPFRPGSSLMMERSLSHKSDGRHSSTGHSVHSVHSAHSAHSVHSAHSAHSVHSVHSAVSGRASSLGLDTTFLTGGHEPDSPIDIPEPPPVFFVLGSVPAIIRCWLTKDFANNTLLYAAVCSGAQKSTVDFSLVKELGLDDLVYREVDHTFKIHLQTYLAEAIPSTKSADPVPQIPFLAVTFEVVGVEHPADSDGGKKSIRIFIGSDALRAHSADLLFSRNLMTLYSSEREKLTVPFVRPEDDSLFKNLCTANMVQARPKLNAAAAEFVSSDLKSRDSVNGAEDDLDNPPSHADEALTRSNTHLSAASGYAGRDNGEQQPRAGSARAERGGSIIGPEVVSPLTAHAIPAAKWQGGGGAVSSTSGPSESGADGEKLPRNSTSSEYSGKETTGSQFDGNPSGSGQRRDASAIWLSWRQGGSVAGSDGGGGGSGGSGGGRENGSLSGYQPAGRPRTMKVLKSKTAAGNGAAPAPAPASASATATARTGSSSYESPLLPSRSSGELRRKGQGPSATAGEGGGSGGTGGSGGGSTTASNVIRWESKRSISSSNAAAHSGATGKEGKGPQQGLAALELRSSNSTGTVAAPRTSNPVGGASAFAWMKSSKPKTPTTPID